MAEWSKAAVSKTVNGLARSGVQIPFSPPDFFLFFCAFFVRLREFFQPHFLCLHPCKKMRSAVLRRARRAHSPVRLNFALLVWLTKKCEMAVRQQCRFAIKVFGKGVRGKNLSSERVFPAQSLMPGSAALPERRRIHP